MNHHATRLIAFAAASALGLALLTGCPAEEKKDTGAASPGTATTTTTTTTTAVSAAPASPAATTAAATSPAAGTTTTSAATAGEGKTLFANRCQACHGLAGAGGMGPKLTDVDKKGDAYVKETILKGRPDKGMPAFEGQLKPSEVDAVVAYVKGL